MQEHRREILGVDGLAYASHRWDNGLFSTQKWICYRALGKNEKIIVRLGFDDECRNGHHTFSITGELRDTRYSGDRGYITGGCIHDRIAKHVPELSPLIKWHLCSTDGPMHYIANTVYQAGDRDCYGLRKGESRQVVNGRTKLPCWRLEYSGGDPSHKVRDIFDGHEPPDSVPLLKWVPLTHDGEGKERDLDAARSCAVWPDATDDQLTQEPDDLRAALSARLPGLIADFRHTMVDLCGFEWE